MEKVFKLHSTEEAQVLFGRHDENLKLIESQFGVKIFIRQEGLVVSGSDEAVTRVSQLFDEFLEIIRKGGVIKKHEISYAIKALANNHPSSPVRNTEFSQKDKISNGASLKEIYLDRVEVSSKRQFVTPKTKGQKEYVDAIRNYDIVFAVGPAGTGKTYLAMAMAVSALKKDQISRIILTRPAVEAGESLGFLPGDLYEKITPYLRPLYDALYDMMEIDKIEKYLEKGIIEVAPLAYMRGRTLNDAFIILDEAQNSTPEQMKMFLTRLGFDSKTVITGDITQSDLPGGKPSGLLQARDILQGIPGIKFIYLSGQDVVRHELVQEIIKAYERELSS